MAKSRKQFRAPAFVSFSNHVYVLPVNYIRVKLSWIDMIVFCICCICSFSIEWVHLWLGLSFHSLNAFGDPHIWPPIERSLFARLWNLQRHALVALLLTESCTSPQRLLLPILTHRWLVWWFLFWQDVTGFIIKRLGLKLGIQSSLSLHGLPKLLFSK